MIRTLRNRGIILPSEPQELLLKAALVNNKESIGFWDNWRARVDLDFIDRDSHRLLPLLFTNLKQQGIEDAVLGRYEGVLKKTWYKNQILFKELSSVLEVLNDNNIRCMILKGVALNLLFYNNFGLRPMNDWDVLVPVNQTAKSIKIIESLGYTPRDILNLKKWNLNKFPRRGFDEEFFSVRNAMGFQNSKRQQVDLHWFLLPNLISIKANDEFWRLAETIKLNDDLSVQTLCPTDQLLHVMVNGLGKGKNANLRWIADAMVIMINSEINWERIQYFGDHYKLGVYLETGLRYLHQILSPPIPERFLFEQGTFKSTEKDKKLFIDQVSEKKLRRVWSQYSKIRYHKNPLIRIILFPGYLKKCLRLKKAWQLPFYYFYRRFPKLFPE